MAYIAPRALEESGRL